VYITVKRSVNKLLFDHLKKNLMT